MQRIATTLAVYSYRRTPSPPQGHASIRPQHVLPLALPPFARRAEPCAVRVVLIGQLHELLHRQYLRPCSISPKISPKQSPQQTPNTANVTKHGQTWPKHASKHALQHAPLRPSRICATLLTLLYSLTCTASKYLELQNKWPFFNKESSFFRGNSPLFLHFQQRNSIKVEIYVAIRTASRGSVSQGLRGPPAHF